MTPRRVLLIEPVPKLLWAIEAKIRRDWPRAAIFQARNGVEGCLLVGRVHPDLVVIPTEVPQTDIIVLIQHLKRPDNSPRPVVVLATDLPEEEPLVCEAVELGVDAVLPLAEQHVPAENTNTPSQGRPPSNPPGTQPDESARRRSSTPH